MVIWLIKNSWTFCPQKFCQNNNFPAFHSSGVCLIFESLLFLFIFFIFKNAWRQKRWNVFDSTDLCLSHMSCHVILKSWQSVLPLSQWRANILLSWLSESLFFSVLIKCTAQQLFSSNNIPLFSKEKHNPLFPSHECFLIEYFCVTLFTKYYNILSHIWRKTLGYFFENTYCDHKLSPQTHGSKGKENTTQSKIA